MVQVAVEAVVVPPVHLRPPFLMALMAALATTALLPGLAGTTPEVEEALQVPEVAVILDLAEPEAAEGPVLAPAPQAVVAVQIRVVAEVDLLAENAVPVPAVLE
jgi:hypothetical protein